MRWNDTIISNDTSLNVTSIAFGNNYYVALAVRVVSDEYHVDILYTSDLNNEWTTKTIYNSGADPILVPGIVFTGEKFVVPFTTNLSNSFSALYFDTPSGNVTAVADIFTYAHPIHLNSVRFVGGKVMVCGNVQTGADDDNISGYTWYCTDPAGVWEAYEVIQYSQQDDIAGNAQAAVYDAPNAKYMVYGVAKQNQNTNIHRIYSSDDEDLVIWDQPREVARDNLSALPFPAFAYCEDYDAVALFLHGQIYVSKAGQRFVTIPYPGGIGAESIRAVTSDGTKFLASSASDNQSNLKVIYSSGDPTVAANWRVQTLAEGQQISSDVKFIDDTDLFVVVAGQGNNLKPTIYTALFAANEFNIMKDRVPTYPGRVSLTSLGQNLYNLARADEPTEEGTKLSKVNLLSDDAALAVWNNTPPDILCTPSTALEHLGNNAFHVGDILTTARDLSTDENWLKCTGGSVSEQDYPELYPLLQTGSVEGDWSTNVIDNSSGVTNLGYSDVATDGEWYVMLVSVYHSNYTWDWYVYYTRDPSSTWTKKTIATASNWSYAANYLSFIYANGYFAFVVSEFIPQVGYGTSYVVYADDPSGTWNTMSLGVTTMSNVNSFKYLNGQYIVVANYFNSGNSIHILTFNEIGGQVNHLIILNNPGTPTYIFDVDYYNGQWYGLYQNINNATSPYNYITRLYHSDNLAQILSNGQYVTIESVYGGGSTSTYNYFQPYSLNCGNGYCVLWGNQELNTGSGRLELFYSSDFTNFTKSIQSQFWGQPLQTSHAIFFDGTFYKALRGTDNQPYIIYGGDPTNFTVKQLFNANIYKPSLAASDASKTLFVSTQGQDYITFTAAWQKVGKSLPKLSPGVGLNAYIKAKEGD